MENRKPTIAIDFDGVLHDYSDGWQGEDVFNKPLKGAAQFTKELHQAGWKIILNTTRKNSWKLRHFLQVNGIEIDEISDGKPMADIYLDDRGLKFEGDFESTKKAIENFKVWYK